jgi:hypothetical protein
MLNREDELRVWDQRAVYIKDFDRLAKMIGSSACSRSANTYSIPGSSVSALARAIIFCKRSSPRTCPAPCFLAQPANHPKPQPR